MIIYTQPNCQPCHRVVDKMKDAGVDFEEIDISKDAVAADYVKRVLQARSTPIIKLDNGDFVVGYQPDIVKEIINAYKA
jgi:glutaredoxin-like protein NrdH